MRRRCLKQHIKNRTEDARITPCQQRKNHSGEHHGVSLTPPDQDTGQRELIDHSWTDAECA